MAMPEYVSTAEFWVAVDGEAGAGGKYTRYGTLKDVSIDSTTNDKLEETFDETGRIRGRGRTSISFDSVIPKAGKRIDFVEIGMKNHSPVQIVCVIAGKKRTYRGIVASNSEKFGINSNAMDNPKLECGEPDIENI